MSEPSTRREAMLLETFSEAARLIGSVEALAARLEQVLEAIDDANARLLDALATFEARMNAVTQQAKTQTVKHLAAYTQEAARRSVEQNSKAMADAARVAFGAQVGGAVERLQATLRSLSEAKRRRWEPWLAHAATATASAVATWMVVVYLGRG